MALQIPTYERLLAKSLPVLENVRSILGQSVYLSILVDAQHVIIGKVEAEGDFGLTIKVGYPTSWMESTPGQLLQALSQRRSVTAEFERSAMASRAVRQMWLAEPNPRLPAITEISVPVFRRGNLIAALTIPFLSFAGGPSEKKCLSVIRVWARTISDEISS
jgi:DNA-binding IclR family transcriptional regulator